MKPGLRFGDFYQDSQVVNEVAFDWLERHQDSRFFLFLHYMDPHDPYFEHPYDGKASRASPTRTRMRSWRPRMQRLYRGEIEYLDANFGKLLDKLRRSCDLYDDTLIVLVSPTTARSSTSTAAGGTASPSTTSRSTFRCSSSGREGRSCSRSPCVRPGRPC